MSHCLLNAKLYAECRTRDRALATISYLILQLNDSIVLFFIISRDLLQNVKLFQRLGDDSDSLPDIFFGNDQWRGESDNVDMCRLGQQSVVSVYCKRFPSTSVPTHPLDFIRRHNCHAVRPFLDTDSSMTTPLNSPRPRMILMKGLLRSLRPCRKISPSRCERLTRSSLTRTSRAVMATAHPRGFLI
jgi:hypothetical protein